MKIAPLMRKSRIAPLFFFSHCQRPRRFTVPAIDYILRQNCILAGIDRINAHALRHTAASHAIEGGMPLHRVRDLLGHSSVLVTSRYLHVAEEPTVMGATYPVRF